MLTWLRWGSLVLATMACIAWAIVVRLRLAFREPSHAEMMAHGEPRRYSEWVGYEIEPPVVTITFRRAEVALRITAALLVIAHLVILNLE